MHLLEASLRSVSRAQGRYINSYAGPPLKSESSDGPLKFSYFFACVLRDRCPFYICFSPHKQFEGEGWICRDACVQHTCVSSAPTISRRLHDFLSFWVSLVLSDTFLYSPINIFSVADALPCSLCSHKSSSKVIARSLPLDNARVLLSCVSFPNSLYLGICSLVPQ